MILSKNILLELLQNGQWFAQITMLTYATAKLP